MSPTASAAPVPSPQLPDSSASVDTDNPWLGLASFTEASRAYFFGREQEITELERRVQRKLLTVLFGKSGLGKTSILQAGLVPGLRDRGYFPVYLRIDYGHDTPEPAEQIKQAISKAAGARAAGGGASSGTGGEMTGAPAIDPSESIWEFLHHRELPQDGSVVPRDIPAEMRTVKSAAIPPAPPITTPIPLLIFDQFEEIFTLAQSDEFGRGRAARFAEELADLVENRPPKALEAKLDTDDSIAERFDFARSDYRVVISLREDYLAPLESLKKQMPSLSQNRLRLAPMTGAQALEAVLLPGNRLRPGKPLVTEEVAEAIVRFVAGGAELANAEVEPSLLSLICRELNEQRIAQHHSEISLGLLAGSHETILSSFYERALADQPPAVRSLIEDELLTESGYRENLAEESLLRKLQTAGAAPGALARLVNRRLLRIEERLDVRRVELTHDVLTGVVKASRDQRREREARAATERLLAEQAARESAARRALRRARVIAAGCTALAVVAIAAAVVAFFSVQRARSAEQLARQTRATSEQAREEAEGLLGFLTDDFVGELETFGRYQTIAELSQREIDYFQHLPPQLDDPQTTRSGALAFVDHSWALQFLGHLDAADRDGIQAVALLERLQRSGDASETTATVLGEAYSTLGLSLATQNDPRGDAQLQRAAAVLRPIATRPGASVEARRAYTLALTWVGWRDQNSGRNEEAVQVEREAMRVAAQLGAGRHVDVTLDAKYAEAASWLASALVQLDRNDEAHHLGEEALAMADAALAQRPQYGMALEAKQIIEGELSVGAVNALDPAAALDFAAQGVQTSLVRARLEPNNNIYVNNLGSAYAILANSMWSAGRLREGAAAMQKAAQAFGEASVGVPFSLVNAVGSMTLTALFQAQLGDPAAVSATLAAGDAFLSPAGLKALALEASYTEAVIDVVRTEPLAEVAYERGDFGAARRIVSSALAKLGAARPDGPYQIGLMNSTLCHLSDLQGRAAYPLGDFAAAAQAERTALQACEAVVGRGGINQRTVAQAAIWLSMALARAGNRKEAARTIAPVVTMYRTLDRKNHGDQWLPLELAAALYAQSLTADAHRAELLREAAQRVDQLIPAIAALHDTRVWRVRIEEAQRAAGGEATPRASAPRAARATASPH